jgi:hypothetical protein
MIGARKGGRTRIGHFRRLIGYPAVILHYGFELSTMDDAYRYGRAAHAADCATLKLRLVGVADA